MRFPLLIPLAALFCSSASFGADGADKAPSPVFVVIHADIKPDYAAQGTRMLKDFADKMRKEKTVGMFEVLAQIGRPNHITLVEEWESQAAYDQHVSAPETVALRARLQDMLGSPFDERLHREVNQASIPETASPSRAP